MTRTICLSCHATINSVVGVSKGSSSGIPPSFGKRNPRVQVPGHPSGSDNFECCRAFRHCGFLGIGAGVVALSVKELWHSAESSVPLMHAPEELKQPVITKREMWEK